jgi:hypothetical protein
VRRRDDLADCIRLYWSAGDERKKKFPRHRQQPIEKS